MKVNFNNVRRQALLSFNEICKTLNNNIGKSNGEGMCVVAVEELKSHFDDLRNTLITICCTFQEDDEDFKCIVDDDTVIEEFNPEKEDGA